MKNYNQWRFNNFASILPVASSRVKDIFLKAEYKI